jgi:hypothetical protein
MIGPAPSWLALQNLRIRAVGAVLESEIAGLRPAAVGRGADPKTTSASIIARLASMVARLRARFGESRLRLCQRVASKGLAAMD